MDILSQIVEYKKSVIARAKTTLPLKEMNLGENCLPFGENLVLNNKRGIVSIIAEIKKGSPSKGVISEDFNVEKIAKQYEDGGASCISVLTEDKFFFGADENIRIAKKASGLPILRKDFIIDEYQIYESKHIGADAILLIASILTGEELSHFEKIAFSLGLSVLVEVHNETEMNTALKYTTSPLIGINNRNLKNFSIDLENTINLMKNLPKERVPVCESGISTKEDIQYMQSKRCNVFLIGTSIVQSNNKAEFIQNLIK